MLPPATILLILSSIHVVTADTYKYEQQRRDDRIQRRARTVTVTETETETITDTETVTETTGCQSAGSAYSNGQLTASATATSPPTPSSTKDVSIDGNCYNVQGVGSFAVKKAYNFTVGTMSPDLQISDYNVPDRSTGNPWNHGFKPSNVYISNGYLNLAVPGSQNPAKDSKRAIYGGEIYTSEANILYGSVRTVAIFDSTPGTCQGIFSYHDDSSEIDIEYMGNTSSTANPSPGQRPVLWYTNQPGGKSDNQVTGPAPADVDSKPHEYRIDWTANWTKFYTDGVLQRTLKGSVPHVGSQWVWNNWANGSPYWSTGPPIGDNIFRIQSIVMYYNVADGPTCGQ